MARLQWTAWRQARQRSYHPHYRRKESERQVSFWIRAPATRTIHLFLLVLSFKIMEPAKIRSAGVTAAAALAIMGSSFGLIIWGFFILPMTNYQDRAGRHLYQIAPLFFGVVALVPPLLIAMGIQTGIGLFQLQRWARKAALIWAAIALFFCLSMIASRPFETFFFPERFVSDLVAFKQILALSFVIMLLPFSIWWLFFFRLASVKAQFEPPNAVPPGDKLH